MLLRIKIPGQDAERSVVIKENYSRRPYREFVEDRMDGSNVESIDGLFP